MSTARIIRTFQKYILSTLLIVMGVVIVASSIELVILVVQELLNPPLLLDLVELTKIGSLFLTVLITVELFGVFLGQDTEGWEVVQPALVHLLNTIFCDKSV